MIRPFVQAIVLSVGLPAMADRLDLPDGFADDLRAVLPCAGPGFISTPSSALAFCGSPVPSVEFIVLPPGREADLAIARLRTECGLPEQACDLSSWRIGPVQGWRAIETGRGPIHATALMQVGDRVLEVRAMAADTGTATRSAEAAAALVLPHVAAGGSGEGASD